MFKRFFKFLTSTRQKAAFAVLLFYWPTIFILTHIFLPQSILAQMRASDKALHFLVYFILIILFWFSLSTENKADLRNKKVWMIFLVLIAYGAADEWLQGLYANRTRDFGDFVSNVAGVAAGLAIICIFSFWPAALLSTASAIVIFTTAVRIQLTGQLAFLRPVFLLLSFGFFTFLCQAFFTYFRPLKSSLLIQLIVPPALALALVAFVKLLSLITSRAFELQDIILSITAIFITTAITIFYQNITKTPNSL